MIITKAYYRELDSDILYPKKLDLNLLENNVDESYGRDLILKYEIYKDIYIYIYALHFKTLNEKNHWEHYYKIEETLNNYKSYLKDKKDNDIIILGGDFNNELFECNSRWNPSRLIKYFFKYDYDSWYNIINYLTQRPTAIKIRSSFQSQFSKSMKYDSKTQNCIFTNMTLINHEIEDIDISDKAFVKKTYTHDYIDYNIIPWYYYLNPYYTMKYYIFNNNYKINKSFDNNKHEINFQKLKHDLKHIKNEDIENHILVIPFFILQDHNILFNKLEKYSNEIKEKLNIKDRKYTKPIYCKTEVYAYDSNKKLFYKDSKNEKTSKKDLLGRRLIMMFKNPQEKKEMEEWLKHLLELDEKAFIFNKNDDIYNPMWKKMISKDISNNINVMYSLDENYYYYENFIQKSVQFNKVFEEFEKSVIDYIK